MDGAVVSAAFWEIAKYPVFVLLMVYLAFSVVVIKQVKLMIDTLEVGFEKPLLLVAYVHMFLSAFVLLFSIIIL